MPNYDEIIEQSQANVNSLSEKLKELDRLHQDIRELIKQPEVFDLKYQQILKLSEDFTTSIGASTKMYLEGNNILLTTKLNELSEQIVQFEMGISRLLNTDFTLLFKDLQIAFIDQTRKDIEVELRRFDEKSKDLQIINDALKTQVDRIESVDLEGYFDRLQKTLSEIFSAINAINLTMTALSQTLSEIVRALGDIQTANKTAHTETKQLINDFKENTFHHLTNQDTAAKKNYELLEIKMKSIFEQNEGLIAIVKTNRVIQIIGMSIIAIILVFIAFKH